MLKGDELFVLVKSLSRSEKRYFKLYCRQEAANYLQLFDIIDRQEHYNEAAIKEKFKGRVFVKQLHVTKSYLRRLILKSLRDFHAGISKDAELKDLLRNIEILFNKELYSHCGAELKRAEQIAVEYDLNTGLAEVHNWQRRLEQQARPHNYAGFADILQKQQRGIARQANANQYWQLATAITGSFTQSGMALPDITLLQDAGNAQSLEAQVLHHNALYFLALRKGGGENAAAPLFTILELLEGQPQRMREEMGLYASTANNLISFLIFIKKHELALQQIKRVQRQYEKWKLVSENKTLLKQVLRTYNVELEIYRDLKTFVENAPFINNIEQFITAHENKMPKEYLLSFYFQLGCIRFMMQQYSKALHWINRVLNNRFDGARTDLQVQVRILNLMVHLEQQNMFVLRHFVDSAKRFINKVGTLQPYEKILLAFFSKIGQAFNYQHRQLYEELYQQLFAGPSPLISSNTLDYIDYKTWLEQKLAMRG